MLVYSLLLLTIAIHVTFAQNAAPCNGCYGRATVYEYISGYTESTGGGPRTVTLANGGIGVVGPPLALVPARVTATLGAFTFGTGGNPVVVPPSISVSGNDFTTGSVVYQSPQAFFELFGEITPVYLASIGGSCSTLFGPPQSGNSVTISSASGVGTSIYAALGSILVSGVRISCPIASTTVQSSSSAVPPAVSSTSTSVSSTSSSSSSSPSGQSSSSISTSTPTASSSSASNTSSSAGSSTSSQTSSSTGSLAGVSTISDSASVTSSPSSSSGLTDSAKLGIGLGVGIGGAILIALIAFIIWYRRRKAAQLRAEQAARDPDITDKMGPGTAVYYGEPGVAVNY